MFDLRSSTFCLVSLLALGLAGCADDKNGTPSKQPDAGMHADLNCSLEVRCSGAGDAGITPSGYPSFHCFDDINPCCGQSGAMISWHCEKKTGRCAFFGGCVPPGWEWRQAPEAGFDSPDGGS